MTVLDLAENLSTANFRTSCPRERISPLRKRLAFAKYISRCKSLSLFTLHCSLIPRILPPRTHLASAKTSRIRKIHLSPLSLFTNHSFAILNNQFLVKLRKNFV